MVIIFGTIVFQVVKKQNLVSPLEDQDPSNVKVIFVTPEPSTSPIILESSPSATPKSSPKVKATSKPSSSANSATPSASPKE